MSIFAINFGTFFAHISIGLIETFHFGFSSQNHAYFRTATENFRFNAVTITIRNIFNSTILDFYFSGFIFLYVTEHERIIICHGIFRCVRAIHRTRFAFLFFFIRSASSLIS